MHASTLHSQTDDDDDQESGEPSIFNRRQRELVMGIVFHRKGWLTSVEILMVTHKPVSAACPQEQAGQKHR